MTYFQTFQCRFQPSSTRVDEMSCACVRWTTISSAVSASKSVALRIRQSSVCLRVNKSMKTNRHTSVVLSLPFEVTTSHLQVILLLLFVWMLLAECSESISHNHTAHIKKCPDSIVGKQQRPQAFLIYSYRISTAIGTWHSVLQSQHISSLLQLTI